MTVKTEKYANFSQNTQNTQIGAGRYAPSPSGDLHLGNLRTALLAWAFARYDGRKFLLRIEDLDPRSRPEHETSQLRDLEAFGIDWDDTPIRQSARIEIYRELLAKLRESNLLYECYCSRKELNDVARAPHQKPGVYSGNCRSLTVAKRAERIAHLQNRAPALRLKTDVREMRVCDRNYGEYCGEVDDLVLLRGDGVFSYNFVSVVDDALTGVEQIVRGVDLLSSVPRQVYLQKVLGYSQPEYAHVPLVLNQAGARLAKRDGAVTLSQLREIGIGVPDLIAQLSLSLGFPAVRSAADFLTVFDPKKLVLDSWVFNTANIAR